MLLTQASNILGHVKHVEPGAGSIIITVTLGTPNLYLVNITQQTTQVNQVL